MKVSIISALFLLITNLSISSYAQQHNANPIQVVHVNGNTIALKPILSSSAKQYSFTSSMHDVKPLAVKKIKGVLKLKLDNGSFISLRDKFAGTENPAAEIYQLKGQFMGMFYLVFVQYYESGEYMLIDKCDGKSVKMWGEPYISPDRLHLVSFYGSLDYDEMPTGIQLYNINGDKVSVAWEYELKDWQPEKIAWKNNNTLVVLKLIPEFISPTKHEVKSYLELSF